MKNVQIACLINLWPRLSKSAKIKGDEEMGNFASLSRNDFSFDPCIDPNWTIPYTGHHIMAGHKETSLNHSDILSGGELFDIFLGGLARFVNKEYPSKEKFYIQALLKSAVKGFIPAQAVISRVFDTYDIPLRVEINAEKVTGWLLAGASTGSSLALEDLQETDCDMAELATSRFYLQGGGHQYLTEAIPERTLWAKTTLTELEAMHAYTKDVKLWIHRLAMWGNHEAIRELLKTTNVLVNDLYPDENSPLHLACVAGAHETVKLLCSHGANASFQDQDGVSCMHWLFNFPADEIENIGTALFKAGAALDSFTSIPSSLPHFPFTYPPGTPLHWAVTASNATAVITLLRMGAKAGIRNGDDPYVRDLNVRELDVHDITDGGLMSTPPGSVQGLSIVDLAAANHDWKILRAIYSVTEVSATICNVDEEGYSAFHRLSHHRVGTIANTYFWYPAFAGPSPRRARAIGRTIEALKIMGGQIDGFTRISCLEGYNGIVPGNLNPLMLAVTKGDIDVVQELLRSGANPNAVNDVGNTALCVLPERGEPFVPREAATEIALLLLKYGANPTHNHSSKLTPLDGAIRAKSLEAIEGLLCAGADPATKIGNVNIFAVLLRNINPNFFQTPESLCDFQQKLISIIKDFGLSSLLDTPCPILKNVDNDQGSLLHYAASCGLPDVVEYLLKLGLEPDIYRQSPEKRQNYNAAARYLTHGTPSDISLYQRHSIMETWERRNSRHSNAGESSASFFQVDAQSFVSWCLDFRKRLDRHERLESILLTYGGRYMRPIAGGRFYR